MALSYRLPGFEGPLDLLLQLIAKHKLDILDIPISTLLEQYLAQMQAMRQADMEIASEFLEMAARLVYWKTISLLPRREEEAQAIQEELAGQLLEYRAYRQAAGWLTQQWEEPICRAPAEFPPENAYRRRHAPEEIQLAYAQAVARGKRFSPPPIEGFSGVIRRAVSVPAKAVALLRRIRREKRVEYASLFREGQGKEEQIAVFLAVLELIKGRRIRIHDTRAGSFLTAAGKKDGNAERDG